jgi:hypothetical protein
MLHPKGNRLNYGDLLSPPAGFKLIRAVGTTYSLDLYALLALPVAMFYQKSLDGDFKQNRYDVLDAIQKSKERIDLFYQRGKSKAPKNYNSLLAFIDDCGIEVRPPIYASSFHPKMWCLRFESKDEVVYRLIIMSRNLTFDRSWDVSCYMDGRVTKSTNSDAAIALFGGAMLSNRALGFIVPLAIMLVSDWFIGFHGLMWAVYGGFIAIVLIGQVIRKKPTMLSAIGGALAGSVLFFLITNGAVWLGSPYYAQDLSGLINSYVAGVPFFRGTLMGDLLFTAIFFGSYKLAEHRFPSLVKA